MNYKAEREYSIYLLEEVLQSEEIFLEQDLQVIERAESLSSSCPRCKIKEEQENIIKYRMKGVRRYQILL